MKKNIFLIFGITVHLFTCYEGGASSPQWQGHMAPVCDFAPKGKLDGWHTSWNQRAQNSALRVSNRFVSFGKATMEVSIPKKIGSAARNFFFECHPTVNNWEGEMCLWFDVVNATMEPQELEFGIISGRDRGAFHSLHSFKLESKGLTRCFLYLPGILIQHKLPTSLVADVKTMRFTLKKAHTPVKLFVNNITLIKAGGYRPPALKTPFQKEIISLKIGMLDELLKKVEANKAITIARYPFIAQCWDVLVEKYRKQITQLKDKMKRGLISKESDYLVDFYQIMTGIKRITKIAQLQKSFAAIGKYVNKGVIKDNKVIVGFASSMEKIKPRAELGSLQISKNVSVSLAHNEKEAFQVSILPLVNNLKDVSVSVGDLHRDDGTVFPRANIKIAPMGYVLTQKPAFDLGENYAGWWPDPILDFMSSCDIANGDLQSFWVRCFAPKNQPAGTYRGKITVNTAGKPIYQFDLTLKVYNFTMPDVSPLPLAVTFWPLPEREGWKKHKMQWADFLADYYISYDSIYEFQNWEFDISVLKHLHDQGRLGKYLLGYLFDCKGASKEIVEAWKKKNIDKIRKRYDQAKAAGILDHAYIYGCDEMNPETFPDIKRAADMIKKAFPDVPIISSARDTSYGFDSQIDSIDGWVPSVNNYDPEKVRKARAVGKKVWWYICMGPTHPWPNMFVDYPAIEGRLLMGAMTAKYRPDGFLYYSLARWPKDKPILKGPFTDWTPGGGDFHGDGSWVCFGKDYSPVATIRLENFRDGIEDYAYYLILEKIYNNVKKKPRLIKHSQNWLNAAENALKVPETLIKNTRSYSRSPQQLYAYRNMLAALVEQALQNGYKEN